MLLYTQRLSQHRQQNPEISFVNMSELDPWLKTADATSYLEGLSETKALIMKGLLPRSTGNPFPTKLPVNSLRIADLQSIPQKDPELS